MPASLLILTAFLKACEEKKNTMCWVFGLTQPGDFLAIIDSPGTADRNHYNNLCRNDVFHFNRLAMIFIAGTPENINRPGFTYDYGVIVLGVITTLFISRILSKTILKGLPSSFTLELPPYRKPLVGRVLVRSIYDRTLFVLARAVTVAAPAGLITWILANVYIGNTSILQFGAQALDPVAYYLGLDGFILLAFILGFPANEIVVPIIIMSYLSTGSLTQMNSVGDLQNLLVSQGWTWLTGVCSMLLCLNHFVNTM